jgi:uncharacterized damage-inducible protein DinB
MLALLSDLIAHKGHANAAMLTAIRAHRAATVDFELWELLHHILLANRFWLLAVLGTPFDAEREAKRSRSFDDLIARYAASQAQETAWIAAATVTDLDRVLEDPLIPGGRCSVADAVVQVCLHTHGHRSQAAKLLRRHGGTPPVTDFIVWLAGRPTAEWPAPPQ